MGRQRKSNENKNNTPKSLGDDIQVVKKCRPNWLIISVQLVILNVNHSCMYSAHICLPINEMVFSASAVKLEGFGTFPFFTSFE